MPSRPIFERSPRQFPDVPEGEIEIPPPITAPTKPNHSIMSILTPMVMAGVMMLASVTASASGMGGLSPVFFASSLVSVVFGIVRAITQSRAYKKATAHRHERYAATLQASRQQIEDVVQRQRVAALETNPSLSECRARVERLDQRLWERAPRHRDYMALRVGLGEQALAVEIKPPQSHGNPEETDALVREAQELAGAYGMVAEVPVMLPLNQLAAAGVVGPREATESTLFALLVQLATHHSPDEVKIAVAYPSAQREAWSWLRWLPHVWTGDREHRLVAESAEDSHDLLHVLDEMVAQRLNQLQGQREGEPPPLPAYVVLLPDREMVRDEPFLHRVMGQGLKANVHLLFMASSERDLYYGCEGILSVQPTHGTLILTGESTVRVPFAPDSLSRLDVDAFGRTMAPIKLLGAVSPSDIPSKMTTLELMGVDLVEQLDIPARWQRARPTKTLSVPLGARAGGDRLLIDLHDHAHGPNGLVAGMVGSGKSELLQTLILSLAIHFTPEQVMFVLLDFKGGSTIDPLRGLPHVVNTLTDLQLDEAPRALDSLEAEIARREELFQEVRDRYGVAITHVDDYMELRDRHPELEPLPYLVLIVDEFAVLKDQHPDDMRRFVVVAVKGRALGFRMILAAQKPAGVVSDDIAANTRFRLCLRVAQREDSRAMLFSRDDAAYVSQVGRAFFSVDSNQLFYQFQAAWSGAPYDPDPTAADDELVVARVTLDGSRQISRAQTVARPSGHTMGTQLQAMVQLISDMAQEMGMASLRRVWLDPLPDSLNLASLRPAGRGWDGNTWREAPWLEPIVGLVDEPTHQRQYPLTLDLAHEGHALIYGAPGSGKSSFLQSAVLSLAQDHAPEDLNLYLIDYGGRLLSAYGDLPQVGAVVMPEDEELLTRLFRFLLDQIDARKRLFAEVNAANLSDYRLRTGVKLPAIVVVLDDYDAFRDAHQELWGDLATLCRSGTASGIHLIMSAGSPGTVRMNVRNNVGIQMALELFDKGEYITAVGRVGTAVLPNRPGRGLVRAAVPLAFQAALPAGTADDPTAASQEMMALVAAMSGAEVSARAHRIQVMPDVVLLQDLLTQRAAAPGRDGASSGVILGLCKQDLDPFVFDLASSDHLVVGGPMGCGKTSALRTAAMSLVSMHDTEALRLHVVGFGAPSLASLTRLPHCAGHAHDRESLESLLDTLDALVVARTARQAERLSGEAAGESAGLVGDEPRVVVLVDNLDALAAALPMPQGYVPVGELRPRDLVDELGAIVRRARGIGVHVIASVPTTWQQARQNALFRELQARQEAVLIGSTQPGDLGLLSTSARLPTGTRPDTLPPGEGFALMRGAVTPIKLAMCGESEGRVVEQWGAKS